MGRILAVLLTLAALLVVCLVQAEEAEDRKDIVARNATLIDPAGTASERH